MVREEKIDLSERELFKHHETITIFVFEKTLLIEVAAFWSEKDIMIDSF